MKKFIIILGLFIFPLIAFADRGDGEQIFLKKHNGDGHLEHYAPADIPDAVYYDDDTDEIIIVADGFSSYYDVVIIRDTPYQTVISTQISGYGDTIDVSSLSTGNYTIVITSEYNNVFEGHFTVI